MNNKQLRERLVIPFGIGNIILALAGVCYLLAGIVALKIEDRVVMKYVLISSSISLFSLSLIQLLKE